MQYSREKILSILVDAEKSLRVEISSAATAGDLEAAKVALSAASGIRQILKSIGGVAPPDSPSRATIKPGETHFTSLSAASRGKPPVRKVYPRFLVSNGQLYRIGWSKRDKGEYQQKLPKQLYGQITSALAMLAKDGKDPHPTEHILDSVQQAGSTEIPAYQVYIALGFLRANGILEQVGREGYKIEPGITNLAEEVWDRFASAKSD